MHAADHLLGTFINSIAWHAGGKVVGLYFIPVVIGLIGIFVYKKWQKRKVV